MLLLTTDLRDLVLAHCKRDHPDEACGILSGPVGSDRATRFRPIRNASATPYTRYEFSSADLLALYVDLEEGAEEPIVVYHSHTHTGAYPSATDLSLAGEPGAHYVVVSTREHGSDDGPVELRSFRIVDDEITEEPVVVVTSYDKVGS